MADKAGAPPRVWQRMLSGRRLDLLDPSPLDIEISDIAHGLARVARWNGQTTGDHAFSVAQHSLLVEATLSLRAPGCSPDWRLAALLHDAPEYVIGDMISPFKATVGGGYKAIEQRLQEAVHRRFGLAPEYAPKLKAAIKQADQVMAFLEATQLAGFTVSEATRYFGGPKGVRLEPALLHPLPAGEAQERFLQRFEDLQKRRAASPGA